MLIGCDVETYLERMNDDPVRPHLFIDNTSRFTGNFRVYADIDKQGFGTSVNAIVCVAIAPFIPQEETQLQALASGELEEDFKKIREELGDDDLYAGKVLCPYSLWSYEKGAGRKLINQLLEAVPIMYPDVDHVITMSPPTKMAMKFHVGNGAFMLSPNRNTINYQYEIEDHDIPIH